MRMVSPKQSHAIASLVGTNTDWDAVPFEAGESILHDPTGFGKEATRFMQNGGRVMVMITDGITSPPGGKVLLLTAVVDESRAWEDAVQEAGPDTGRDWDIWRVGDQYPPTMGARSRLKQVIITNFGKGVQSEEALAWGKEQKLKPTTPRACFAVSEHYPVLHHYLDMDPMAVVTLASCSVESGQRVPFVWFAGAERGAVLSIGSAFGWLGYCWFAFDRE